MNPKSRGPTNKKNNNKKIFTKVNVIERDQIRINFTSFCDQAEELIKKEMLVMQHFDAVHTPTPGQLGMGPGKKNQKNVTSQAQHLSYLQQHPYDKFTEDDLEQVGIVKQMW